MKLLASPYRCQQIWHIVIPAFDEQPRTVCGRVVGPWIRLSSLPYGTRYCEHCKKKIKAVKRRLGL